MDLSQRVRFFTGWCGLVLAVATTAPAATLPVYENNAPMISPPTIAPQIDAVAWVNRSEFDVLTFLGLPYESQNTRFFTNTPSGFMVMDPGIRFFRNANGLHNWMDTWVNLGSVTTDHDSFFANTFFFQDSRASILQVLATNIVSKGFLSSGAAGLVRLEGKTVSLPRIGIRTGENPGISSAFFFSTFIGSSNYVNDVGITDVYWAAGTNNSLRPNRPPMFLGALNLDLPFPSSPLHDVAYRSFGGFLFTNSMIIPGSFFATTDIIGRDFLTNGFAAAVYTNTISPTSSVVQVVFYPTNTDAFSSTEVRFSPGFGPSTVVVAFRAVDFDISTQSPTTNSVFLVDALAENTNAFHARNVAAPTRRPSTYEVSRTTPIDYLTGVPSNATYFPNILSGPQFLRAAVTNLYTAYAARVANLGSSASGTIPYDVTNVPGRVDIIGDEVNLDQTRIRSESAVVIKANNLISNRLASIDAPLINFDVGSTQPVLVISNLAPNSVRRFQGSVQAWSARWENFELVNQPNGTVRTNNVLFHVLLVDSTLQGDVPVVVNEFAIRGNDHIISDALTVAKSFRVEGNSLTLSSGLITPFGYSLGSTNLVGLLHFTNDGTMFISGIENMGADRGTPYTDYVNRGTNAAYSHFINAVNLENSGTLQAVGGPMVIDSVNLNVAGLPYAASNSVVTNVFFQVPFGLFTNVFTNVTVLSSPATLDSVSELRLNVANLTMSNAWFNAGTLVLNVSDTISDGGTNAISFWNVTNGFQSVDLPATGSLMGTYLRSTVPRLLQSDHTWSAADVGAVPAGYVNNLAVGKLTLDGGAASLFNFAPANGVNAIYVDYLELLNTATNYNTAFAVDPDFTIYFANANVSVEKLNNALDGRFRWVSDFAGPLSSTNIFYPSTGQTYTFNVALVRSKDLDSDGDGIANANDPEPIYVPESAFLTVELAHAPARAVLRWSALAYSTNAIEFKSSASNGPWNLLTNFVHGGFTSPVSIADPVPTNGASRLYRLKVNPLQP
jgi:hypothetical protein